MQEDLIKRRARLLGPNVPVFYDDPVHLVRGSGTRVWDKDGREFLDCYNNVPHVGHCHPRVVDAICQQAATLNTHTRYLHDLILDYVEALTATLDTSLSTMIMTCTGSEANDVALRMAQAATGKTGVIVTDATYHGNTMAVSQLGSSNPPLGGRWPNVRMVSAPDSYRGCSPDAFAKELEEQIADLQASGHGFSAFLICPYFANEGFPDLPSGWLDAAVNVVRKAGGVIIADEVQSGFGRTGTHLWAHEKAGFVPDIMTLGKPMGNGHPVGAVVTSPDTMAAFREGFRYFNTFGGNPVSCAAAMETLNVLMDEELVQNAQSVGEYARNGLRELSTRYDVIGDVRGSGLFFGAELVVDREAKTPNPELTKRVANEMRKQGVLLNFIGRHRNILKIRPPMPFSRSDADQMIETLDAVFSSAQP